MVLIHVSTVNRIVNVQADDLRLLPRQEKKEQRNLNCFVDELK